MMNKTAIVKELVSKNGMTLHQANAAVTVVVEAIISSLAFGQDVKLRGLGTLKVIHRGSCHGRDIYHHKKIIVPARRIVKFMPSRQLKELVK